MAETSYTFITEKQNGTTVTEEKVTTQSAEDLAKAVGKFIEKLEVGKDDFVNMSIIKHTV